MKSIEARLDDIEAALEQPLTDEQRQKIRAALRSAISDAMHTFYAETVKIVESHLQADKHLMRRINEEAVARQRTLIANLSAMR